MGAVIVVLVLAERSAALARQSIRESWGARNRSASIVRFVVGVGCLLPPNSRVEYTCDHQKRDAGGAHDPSTLQQHLADVAKEEDALQAEQAMHGDLLRV